MSWMGTFCVRDLGELKFARQHWVLILDAIESKTPLWLPTNTKEERSGTGGNATRSHWGQRPTNPDL